MGVVISTSGSTHYQRQTCKHNFDLVCVALCNPWIKIAGGKSVQKECRNLLMGIHLNQSTRKQGHHYCWINEV
jgi:hypothetical protein